MAIDSSGVWPPQSYRRGGGAAAVRLRVREERKRVIRMSNEKYRTIDDHESGLRRFVLIKNTLRRLQREAREEKLARHRAGAANVSASYLSASRPRSPSPPCDMQVSDVLSVYGQPSPAPMSAIDDDEMLPPAKKPKLFHDDDKENEIGCERLCEMEEKDADVDRMDDTQEILRDLYESFSEPVSPPRPATPTPPRPEPASLTTSLASFSSSYTLPANSNSTSSLNASQTQTSTTNMYSSSFYDWSRPQQQQYACGHASLLGNDLQSVVFHSLIASLES